MKRMMRLQAAPGLFLVLTLILALTLPAAALEEGNTVRVTCEYPEDLCTFTVKGPNSEETWPLDSGIPYDEGKDFVWLDFEIGNIAEGYRIKSVTFNGADETEGFVNGGYGGMAAYIRADTAVQVELEPIPAVLPSITDVTLYTDAALTREAAENLSYEAGSKTDRLFGKGTYSDGGAYPSYYATGQWEYCTDGTNWLPARTWGSNRWDFWPGWQGLDGNGHPELDFVNASYDMRLRVTPNGRYTGGGDVLSNVVRVNGGASGASAEEPVRLSNPTDLTWGRYRPDDTVDFAYNGMIAWQEDTSQPEHTTEITVWRKDDAGDVKVFESGHIVRTGSSLWREEHDFINNQSTGLENGTYYFTLQARGDGETCADSDIVRSGEWAYTAPGRQIDIPTGPEWSWPNAVWNPSTDPGAGGYIVEYYYSATNDSVTGEQADRPSGDVKRVGGYVWWFEEGEKTAADAFHDISSMKRFLSNGAGYYYFRVQTLSADVMAAKNSDSSVLSAAYYYNGSEEAGGGLTVLPVDLRWGVDANGKSRPGCMSWTAGEAEDFLYFDIDVVNSEGKSIYQGQDACDSGGNGRWSSMLLSYLDEGLISGSRTLPAGDYRFRVRTSQQGQKGDWSAFSEAYHYVPPVKRLETPSGARWAGLYPLMTWTPAADGETAYDYFVRYYYSKTNGHAVDTASLEEASGTLHMTLDKSGLTDNHVFVDDRMNRSGEGWYYFTVQAVSGDRDNWLNSLESPLSDGIYFDGTTVVNGGPAGATSASDVKNEGGKLSFTVSTLNYSKRDGSLLAVGLSGGRISDASYTTKQNAEFSLEGETAVVFLLEEETWIPLAKPLTLKAG